MKNILYIVISLVIFTACTTTKLIEVPIESTKTEYIHNIKHDSIYIYDSVDRIVAGEKEIITKFKTQFVYKYITDTIVRVDSIPYPIKIETIREVEINKLRWYQHLLMYIGIFSIIIYSIKRFLNKFKI